MNTVQGLHELVYRPGSLPRMQRLHFTTVPSETHEGSGNDAEQTVSFIFTRRPELQLMCHSMKPAMVIFSRGKGAKPVETLLIKNDFPKPPWGQLAGKQHPKTKKQKLSYTGLVPYRHGSSRCSHKQDHPTATASHYWTSLRLLQVKSLWPNAFLSSMEI